MFDKFASVEVPAGNSLDPDPIRPADFWKIHAEAVNASGPCDAGAAASVLVAVLLDNVDAVGI